MDISALRLAAIVESSDDAIIGKDLDGTITFWNRAAERIFGFTAAEAIGRPITVIIPEDHHEEEADVLRRIRRGETVHHFETVRRRRDGTVVDISLTISPVRDASGQIVGASTIARDITERRRASAAMADLQRRLQTLVLASSSMLRKPDVRHVHAVTIATARELSTADAAAIWRLDPGLGWRVVQQDGLSSAFASRVIASYRDGPATTIEFSEPLRVEDVTTMPLLGEQQDAYRREGIHSMLVLPLVLHEERSGTLVFYYRRPHAFSDVEVDLARALANVAATAINIAELYEAAELGKRRAAFLADAGSLLAQSLDSQQTLAGVAQLAVPDVADWCAVDIVKDDGAIERLAVAHVDPAKVALAKAFQERYPEEPESRHGVYEVIRTGKPVMMSEIPDELIVASARSEEHLRAVRELGVTSYMSVPLHARGRTMGVLTFVSAESGRRYGDEDLRFAEEVAARAALAMANARAYEDAHRLAQELRATEHRITELVESVPGIVWEAWGEPDAASQRIDFVSGYVETMLGYSVAEWLGTPNFWRTIVHPDDREQAARVAAAAFERGESHTNQFRWITKDGRTIWAEARADVIRGQDGRPVGMRGVTLDITRRKQAEQRFERVVEAAPTAIIAVDRRGTIVLVNALTEQLFGYARDELIGQSVERLVPERFRATHPGYRTGFVAAPQTRAMGAGRDLYGLRKDGSEMPIEIGLNPIDVDGELLVLSSIVDISERKRAEEERSRLLERERQARAEADAASRAKDEFLAIVSHELRTPLNAIVGYVRMLRMDILDADQRVKALATVDRNAVALQEMIEDVLDVSRIITGKLRLKVQPVELSHVLTEALASVAPAAEAKGVRLQPVIDTGLLPVSGDPGRLQQVVWNLLSNAVKFTPRGGRVQLRLERVNSHVEIVVSDTGQGIDPAFLPHVFERFRQADSRYSRVHGGLGLGLAIVREIVELHGGTVAVASEGPGTGTTFRVSLPLMIVHPDAHLESIRVHPHQESAAPDGIRSVAARLTGIRVFCVDDERDSRDLLRTVLEAAGATVTTAASAHETLALLETTVPDVLIADIGMPGMDGLELISAIRRSDSLALRSVPATALSAYARSEDRVSALAAGFQMHLAKPIDPSELIAAVAALARRTGV